MTPKSLLLWIVFPGLFDPRSLLIAPNLHIAADRTPVGDSEVAACLLIWFRVDGKKQLHTQSRNTVSRASDRLLG